MTNHSLPWLLINVFGALVIVTSVVSTPTTPPKGKKVLIKVRGNETAKWVDESDIPDILRVMGFFDLTHRGTDIPARLPSILTMEEPYPTSPKHNETVQKLWTKMDMDRVEKFLVHFGSFHSRFYQIYHGPGSSNEWLFNEVQKTVKGYPKASVKTIDVPDQKQFNIIASLEGGDSKLKSEIIILGAHQDSISYAGRMARAPGIDDNGSGSSIVLEMLKVIVSSGLRFKRTVEFHWYSCEEIGIQGSGAVAEAYRSELKNVIGMLNLDVLGYAAVPNTIGIFSDHTDKNLTDFIRMIHKHYGTYAIKERSCTYYCSDHARWDSQGYPAAFISEAKFNVLIHTAQDTMDNIDFAQLAEFARLVVAFVVELGGPMSTL